MKRQELKREKRTQRDYSIELKLRVVSQVETGILLTNKLKKSMESRAEIQFWFACEGMVT